MILLGGCRSHPDVSLPMAESVCRTRGEPAAFAYEHRFQFILTEVIDGRRVDHVYRADAEYFYPASTIKLIGAVAALQTMESLGASIDAPIGWGDVDRPGESLLASDGSVPVLRRELERMLIVSDNEAFNMCFDLAGQRELNETMWDAGLSSVKIEHRLSRVASAANRTAAAPMRLETASGSVLLPRRAGIGEIPPPAIPGLSIGSGFMRGGTLVREPMRFDRHNRISLRDLHELTIAINRPDLARIRLPISASHRELLAEFMSKLAPVPEEYKPFFPGVCRVLQPSRVRVASKIGLAYGFLTDTACITDLASGREFFLTATIYVNSDGVLNDDAYDYDAVGFPVLADLAEAATRRVFEDPADGVTSPGSHRETSSD
jgi:hypothetical protein